MCSRYAPVWVVLAAVITAPVAVLANVGAFGGRGASLAPRQESSIRMAAEDVFLELKGEPLRWHVKAVYRFENPTSKQVEVQMGFPESPCPENDHMCGGDKGRFSELRTLVRGKQVESRVERLTLSGEWAKQIRHVYLYDVTFAPREKVEVIHTYRVSPSYAYHGLQVAYLTKTGSLWNGPIGDARFTIRVSKAHLGVAYPTGFRLVSYGDRLRDGQYLPEVVLHRKNWTPTSNLRVEFAQAEYGSNSMGFDTDPCWFLADVIGGSKLPAIDEGYTHREMFFNESDAEIEYCRSYVEALHGRPFPDEARRQRYYKQYSDAYIQRAFGPDMEYAGPRSNPNYTPECLSPAERQYIDLLDAELAARAAAAKNDEGVSE